MLFEKVLEGSHTFDLFSSLIHSEVFPDAVVKGF